MRRFESKRVIITGASKGIGRAIAERLAAEKCALALLARSGDLLAQPRRRL